MANVQCENGYLRIANELFDVILKSNFSLRELKVILTIIRFTYGFNRKEAEVSIRFISQATGIRFQHIAKAIDKLIAKNVLIINGTANHKQGRTLSLNKDYDTWSLNCHSFGNSSQKGDGCVPKKVTVRVPKKVTKKIQHKIQHKDRERENTLENDKMDIVTDIMIRSYGRYPNIPEREIVQEFVDRFGEMKTLSIMKEARLKNFRNFLRLKESLDENGNIKPLEDKNNGTKTRIYEFDPERAEQRLKELKELGFD